MSDHLNVQIAKSFWHNEEKNGGIFDVQLQLFGENVGMVSFSKSNQEGQYWEPHADNHGNHGSIFKNLYPSKDLVLTDMDTYLEKRKKYDEVVKYFISKAKQEFDPQNKWK